MLMCCLFLLIVVSYLGLKDLKVAKCTSLKSGSVAVDKSTSQHVLRSTSLFHMRAIHCLTLVSPFCALPISPHPSAVIVATGARALWLNAPGEELVRGRGVSTCATCDGAFFRGQHVMVVGGGDAAMEEALFLTRFASKVTVVHRSDRFRASRVMLERAQRHPKIDILPFRRVSEWLVDETQGPFPTLKGAVLEDPRRTEAGRQELACSGAFVAIGHAPVTGLFAGQLKMDEDGYIVHRKRTMTSVAGVFAAGDVVDKVYRQAITAAGMGCQAAMDAERWLSEIRAEEEQAARGVI